MGWLVCVSTLWVKKQDTELLPITSPNVNGFSKFFHCQTWWYLFATNSDLNIPPNLTYVATHSDISFFCQLQPSKQQKQGNWNVKIRTSQIRRQGQCLWMMLNLSIAQHVLWLLIRTLSQCLLISCHKPWRVYPTFLRPFCLHRLMHLLVIYQSGADTHTHTTV